MPKSKRNKVVHLTQVKKKTGDHKKDLLSQVEELIKSCKYIYVFDFTAVKSDVVMKFRIGLKDFGRIFAGKNSITKLAFRNSDTTNKTDFSALTKQFAGHRGLLFTDVSKDKLIERLDSEYPEFCAKLAGFAEIKTPGGASVVFEPR